MDNLCLRKALTLTRLGTGGVGQITPRRVFVAGIAAPCTGRGPDLGRLQTVEHMVHMVGCPIGGIMLHPGPIDGHMESPSLSMLRMAPRDRIRIP